MLATGATKFNLGVHGRITIVKMPKQLKTYNTHDKQNKVEKVKSKFVLMVMSKNGAYQQAKKSQN